MLVSSRLPAQPLRFGESLTGGRWQGSVQQCWSAAACRRSPCIERCGRGSVLRRRPAAGCRLQLPSAGVTSAALCRPTHPTATHQCFHRVLFLPSPVVDCVPMRRSSFCRLDELVAGSGLSWLTVSSWGWRQWREVGGLRSNAQVASPVVGRGGGGGQMGGRGRVVLCMPEREHGQQRGQWQ